MSDIVLSHTQISTWRSCPRSYYFKYIVKRVPISVDDKLSFGRLWDEATGVWWEKGEQATYNWLIENAATIDEIDAIKIAQLIKNYHPPDGFDLIETQCKIDVPIRHPDTDEELPGVKIRCKADSILDFGGKKYIREAKITTKDIEGYGPFWRTLQANAQVGIYWLAFGADGMVYDVAHKPGIKPSNVDIDIAAQATFPDYDDLTKTGKAKARKEITREEQIDAYQDRMGEVIESSPEKFFQFREINKTESDVRQAKEDLWAWANMMLVARDRSWWPRNDHSCSSFYGTCQYLDVCSGVTTIDDDALYITPEWAIRHSKGTLPF